MEGLLSLLLFGAFFYFMMRFGCGAHMVHGHGGHSGHEGHGGPVAVESSANDPVCGMQVEAGKGYAKMHEGRPYRFCSRKCLDRFEAEPQSYVSKAGGKR